MCLIRTRDFRCLGFDVSFESETAFVPFIDLLLEVSGQGHHYISIKGDHQMEGDNAETSTLVSLDIDHQK